MRAAVYHGRGDIRIENVADPVPGRGDVLLEVRSTGICGTDASEYKAGPFLYPIAERHPVSGHVGPMIPGHELAGTVVATGTGVHGFRVGQLVVSGAGISCGHCAFCRDGQTNLCATYSTVGLQRNGGLAEYCAVPASTCIAVDHLGLGADTAALAQPMSVAVHSMRQGAPQAGDDVVVVGAGGVGVFLAFALVRLGTKVQVVDMRGDRLEVARQLGVDNVLRATDPARLADELMGSRSEQPRIVYEVTGSASALHAAITMARRGGTVVAVGLHNAPREVDMLSVTLRELTVVGTMAHVYGRDLPTALDLLAVREDPWSDVAPEVIGLDELVPRGIMPLVDGTGPHIKTLVDPHARTTRTAAHGGPR